MINKGPEVFIIPHVERAPSWRRVHRKCSSSGPVPSSEKVRAVATIILKGGNLGISVVFTYGMGHLMEQGLGEFIELDIFGRQKTKINIFFTFNTSILATYYICQASINGIDVNVCLIDFKRTL